MQNSIDESSATSECILAGQRERLHMNIRRAGAVDHLPYGAASGADPVGGVLFRPTGLGMLGGVFDPRPREDALAVDERTLHALVPISIPRNAFTVGRRQFPRGQARAPGHRPRRQMRLCIEDRR